MSLKEWKMKYYPKEANKVTKEEAIEHSLLKWEGIMDRNRYGLDPCGYYSSPWAVLEDYDGSPFDVDSQTCALCHLYYNDSTNHHPCSACPIRTEKGRDCSDEYKTFVFTGDARPMWYLLTEIKESL